MTDWVAELRRAFGQLQAGGQPQVSFAAREDAVGELGREFNSLALGWEASAAAEESRERAHRLRNQLAGILAALHVLKETGSFTPDEQASLGQLLEEAKKLDARWLHR